MPRSGEPHPDFPGCFWSPPLNTYACDDGFTVEGDPLPPGLLGQITGGNYQPPTISNGTDPVRVTELGEVTGAQLSGLIQTGGGHYDASTGDPLVAFAKSQWWKFSTAASRDGQTVRITENNYLFYGGLALAGIVLVAMFSGD